MTNLSPPLATLDTWSNHAWDDGVQLETLPGLEGLRVQTKNSIYEISVLTPQTGEVLIRGGRFFPKFTPVVLAGATLGGSCLKQRGIYVGFLMELQYEGQTLVTTRVRSIARVGCGPVQ